MTAEERLWERPRPRENDRGRTTVGERPRENDRGRATAGVLPRESDFGKATVGNKPRESDRGSASAGEYPGESDYTGVWPRGKYRRQESVRANNISISKASNLCKYYKSRQSSHIIRYYSDEFRHDFRQVPTCMSSDYFRHVFRYICLPISSVSFR